MGERTEVGTGDTQGRSPALDRAGIGDEIPYVELMAPTPVAGVPAEGETRYETAQDTPTGVDSDLEVERARARIEETRADMTGTIDAIQEKLSPANLAQQAKDSVREATIGRAQSAMTNVSDTATDVGSGIVETIRQNPVPAALAGIGIGWLFMSRRSGTRTYRSGQYQYRPAYRGYYGRADAGYGGYDTRGDASYGRYERGDSSSVGDAVQGAQQTASRVANQAQDTTQQVVGQAQDTAGQIVGQAQAQASQLGQRAQDQAAQAASGFQEMLYTNPLGVAALAVAVGAAIGLAVPNTPQENELMGETRESVVERVQQSAQQTMQKVGAVAQEAVGAAQDAAKESAERQNLT